MSKFDFISGLENPGSVSKQKYQIFKVQMGFESVKVYIPFEQADAFEKEATLAKPKSSASLQKIVHRYGGSIEQ